MLSAFLEAKRTRNDESGMTLIELIISITVLGVIIGPLSAAIIIGLRNQQVTLQRLEESHDAQLVAIYLPPDVQSATEVTSTAGDTACSGVPNVLGLGWQETTGSFFEGTAVTTTYQAAYAIQQEADEWRLLRFLCLNGAAPHERMTAAHNLSGSSAVTADVSANPKIVLTLTEESGYTYSVSGLRRKP